VLSMIVIIAMLLVVLPMLSMIVTITMLLAAVMMISCHCHLLTNPCSHMFLLPTLPHLLAPITIQHVMPIRNCTILSRYSVGVY
jgi:hypothetical protein